jgi:hypothetical protein
MIAYTFPKIQRLSTIPIRESLLSELLFLLSPMTNMQPSSTVRGNFISYMLFVGSLYRVRRAIRRQPDLTRPEINIDSLPFKRITRLTIGSGLNDC